MDIDPERHLATFLSWLEGLGKDYHIELNPSFIIFLLMVLAPVEHSDTTP